MDRRIELVISHLEANASRSWATAQLAALVNLSASRFRHLFKQETGATTSQFLRERRLERAEFMLRTTFLSVKEIMHEAGLTSMSHFVEYFKKKYGTTPTTYRKKWLAERPQPHNKLNQPFS